MIKRCNYVESGNETRCDQEGKQKGEVMGIDSKVVAQLRNSMNALREYDKLEYEIQFITGLSIRELRDLLAAGYTLKPPGPPVNLGDFATPRKKKRGRPKKTP